MFNDLSTMFYKPFWCLYEEFVELDRTNNWEKYLILNWKKTFFSRIIILDLTVEEVIEQFV